MLPSDNLRKQYAVGYFDEISDIICVRLIESRIRTAKTNDFMVSSERVSGSGVESIRYPEQTPVEMSLKTCCLTSCDMCRIEPRVNKLSNKPWMRSCGKFSQELLYEKFCAGSNALAQLSLGMQTSLENSRISYIDKEFVKELNNLQNFWIDGVQGQVVKSDDLALTVYQLILELNEGTGRYNKYQDYLETSLNDIYIIGSSLSYTKWADSISKRCQSLFACGPINCDNIKWIRLPITSADIIVVDKQFLKGWDVFDIMKRKEYEECLEYALFKHFKIGAWTDYLYNAVAIKLNETDQQKADGAVAKVNQTSDLTVSPSANTEPAAKLAVETNLKALIGDISPLTANFEYGTYVAPTEDADGSLPVTVKINKNGDTLSTSNQKTFVVKYKALASKK